MNILLVNDDGIQAPGLQMVAKFLAPKHKVYIAAPLQEQSGMSQALTLHRKLKIYKQELNLGEAMAYAVDGTPGDCVKIALESLYKDKNIQMVISGINNGYNLGTDVIYSGTVGAATEGFLHDRTAFAFSQAVNNTIPSQVMLDILEDIMGVFYTAEEPKLYNINFPPALAENYQILLTEQGIRRYEHEFIIKEVAEGEIEYNIVGQALEVDNTISSDIHAINEGNVSITPLITNRTDYTALTVVKD